MKNILFILLTLLCVKSFAMSEAEARKFCDTWLKSWVGGKASVPQLLTFYTKDAQYFDPNVPNGIQGHRALGDFLSQMLDNYPNWDFKIVKIYPTDKGFILHYNGKIPLKDGRVIENYRGVDILEFQNGLISKQEGFFDRSVFQ